MSKHNCWAVERRKLGRDAMRQKPAAVGNARKNVDTMERCRFGIWCLATSNTSCKASASKPVDKSHKTMIMIVDDDKVRWENVSYFLLFQKTRNSCRKSFPNF